MRDLVIIGAGMAGLTSAIYAVRAGKDVLVLEKSSIGGQISTCPKVENFPAAGTLSGMELSDKLFDQATGFGAEVDFCEVERAEQKDGYFTLSTDSGTIDTKTLILATGVTHRKLGIAGEEDYEGNGLSYCAICDGAFFKGGRVAVVGGGNAAAQAALYLSGICEKVTLIHRRDTLRAEEALQKALKTKRNIDYRLSCTVQKLLGDGKLENVVLDGKDGEQTLPLDALFVCVGQSPANERFAGFVELDEKGYIVASEDCKTSRAGVFAAGDCRTKRIRQLTTAAADGAVAALAACDHLDSLC